MVFSLFLPLLQALQIFHQVLSLVIGQAPCRAFMAGITIAG
jgi:hypothetical protein